MGKISKSPGYVNDMTGTGLSLWGSWGGGLILKNQNKLGIFNLRSDRILKKFYFWKDIVSQSSNFKSRLDLVTLGGVGRETKILENA